MGQAEGGGFSLECIGGHLQVDTGETGIFREAVPPGRAGGASGQQDTGVLQGLSGCKGAAEPPSLWVLRISKVHLSLGLGTTRGDKLLFFLPVEGVKTVAKSRPSLSYHKRKDI